MSGKRGPLAARLSWHTIVSDTRSWNGTPCWEWAACIQHGYAVTNNAGKKLRAHRASFEVHIGPIPDGLTLDHLCENTICINPAHLEPVTRAENNRRAAQRMTVCRRAGHPNLVRKQSGVRYCRECARLDKRRSRARLSDLDEKVTP